jgi:hypothetical protein
MKIVLLVAPMILSIPPGDTRVSGLGSELVLLCHKFRRCERAGIAV